jgi:hypothetical protein
MRVDIPLRKVCLLSVEEPGDYIFTPAGVVIVTERAQFNLYCVSANHNVYRAALLRLDWTKLERGAEFRGRSFRLEDITADMAQLGWTHASAIPDILRHLYESNPRHLFFLQRYLR